MTAVEQFFKDLCDLGFIEYPDDAIVQNRLNLALETEKEQHNETFEAGYGALYPYFEQYYFETYKKDNK